LSWKKWRSKKRPISFLYQDADQCWLTDTQTFEQIGLRTALIGKRRPLLQEGMPLSVTFVDGQPILGEFHEVIDARIAFALPGAAYDGRLGGVPRGRRVAPASGGGGGKPR